DPANLLLTQAEEEVLRQELEVGRLEQTLARLQRRQLDVHQVKRTTPLAFPLMVERFRESMSSERLADRIRRMVAELDKAAGPGGDAPERNAAIAVEKEARPPRNPRPRKDGTPKPRKEAGRCTSQTPSHGRSELARKAFATQAWYVWPA